MGALSPAHLIIILVIALLILGPGKLPETGAALGRAFRDFRNAMEGKDDPAPATPGSGQIAEGGSTADAGSAVSDSDPPVPRS